MSVILGISEEHDAGAAIVQDGALVAAVNEERLSRRKYHVGFPFRSLAYLLKATGIQADDIDAVALGGRIHVTQFEFDNPDERTWLQTTLELLSRIGIARLLTGTEWGTRFSTCMAALTQPGRKPRVRKSLAGSGISKAVGVYDHHWCHALTAAFASGWQDCTVITVDGAGDGYCSRAFSFQDGAFHNLVNVPFYHSPGYYYMFVTRLAGFKHHREGKITGLSAHGDPKVCTHVFDGKLRFHRGRGHFYNHGRYLWAEYNRLRRELDGYELKDIAAAVQKNLETNILAYVRNVIAKTGRKQVKLALAGGIFANVLLNQKIAQLPEVEEIFIFPHMGDGGLAAGAAMAAAHRRGEMSAYSLPHVYLGAQPDTTVLPDILLSLGPRAYRSQDIERDIALALANGHVVARCHGPMEYGPRALGHRSILYQATDTSVNDWLNKKLGRTEYMPFAPILQQEDMDTYFTGTEKCRHALEFMTICVDANATCKREAPAITHIDGTARPQGVVQEREPSTYRVLGHYKELTGLGVLINTSFNMHEEPIVESYQTALESFHRSRIDYLAVEDYLVMAEGMEKPEQEWQARHQSA